MKKILCLFILTALFNISWGIRYKKHEEPQISISTRTDLNFLNFFNSFQVKEKYIEQSLDHFNPQDTRRWMMRYYENDAYFQSGGPIFIYLGGEWRISPGNF